MYSVLLTAYLRCEGQPPTPPCLTNRAQWPYERVTESFARHINLHQPHAATNGAKRHSMLETFAAQLRYTASVVFGLPFSARSLDRLVDALLATHHEFGAVAPDGAE